MDKYILPKDEEKYDEYINRILESRENKKVNKSQQNHHILPKSLGGNNDKDNLIWLYLIEHTYAHILLSKKFPNNSGLAYAAHCMGKKQENFLSGEELDFIAQRNSENQRKRVSGEGNPMFGKHHTKESKEKNAKSQKGRCAGEKNPMYGVHLCGELHPRYGKEISKEQREKQSNSMKGKYKGDKNPRAIKIKCKNTNQIFNTLKDAAEWCGLKHPADINASIKNNKSAGKHPVTREKLYWENIEN